MFTGAVQNSLMEDVSILHVNADKADWTAQVRKVVINPVTDSAEISDIQFTFPQQELTVRAQTGIYDIKTDYLTLNGSVLAHQDHIDIETDSIQWLAKERKLVTEAHVTITGETYKITGDGLDISEDGKVMINKNVRSLIAPKGA